MLNQTNAAITNSQSINFTLKNSTVSIGKAISFTGGIFKNSELVTIVKPPEQ